MCVSFPLTFEYLPDGRLFVNFIRCEGDNVGSKIVDQSFVLETINEIRKREPSFFEELLMNKILIQNAFVSFYTYGQRISFDSKLKFNRLLASLLKENSEKHHNLRTYLHSFIQTTRQAMETTMQAKKLIHNFGHSLILDEDLEELEDKIKSYFLQNFEENLKTIDNTIEETEALAKKKGICEMYLDGKVKKLRINDYVQINYDKPAKIQVSHVYFRKKFDEEAFDIIIDYISEVLCRVGVGGFPLDAPVSIMLDVLGEYVNNIEFRCNAYSCESDVVSLNVAKKVIEDLDTNFALGSIYSARTKTL